MNWIFDADPTNTGKIFIGFGFQPVATVGVAGQGEILLQAGGFNEPSIGGALDKKYKQSVWATSDTVNQSLVVEEEVES